MKSPALARARDLEAWAGWIDARTELPRLLRRLLLASGVERITFPAGEAADLSGWDGTVVSRSADPMVPTGTSGWEVSAAAKVARKVDSDYEERSADPLGLIMAESTYVAVALRRWPGKRAWSERRRGEGRWLDVRGIDSSDLETWLERFPAVHYWVSRLLGKAPAGVYALDDAWEDWAHVTRPAATAALVLAGRDQAVADIHAWLDGSNETFAVKAETKAEATAVILAAVQVLPENARLRLMSHALIVRDRQAWECVVQSSDPVLLIPAFEDHEAVSAALRRRHRVLLPLAADDLASAASCRVQRIELDAAVQALQQAGVPESESPALARLARRSFAAFRRRMAIRPDLEKPSWARSADAQVAIAATLCGQWRENSVGDQKALESLARRSYDTVRSELLRWVNEGDAPARLSGDMWYPTSKDDAYELLARQITTEDLRRLSEVTLDALTESTPALPTSPIESALANYFPPKLNYSSRVREGLADTLALVTARGNEVTGADGRPHASAATAIAAEVLRRFGKNPDLWSSLRESLPLLAEASPDAFCDALDAGLLDARRPIHGLFDESGSPLRMSSSHTGVLWALEVIAWSGFHLARAAGLLAALARADPGGRLTNRPRNSLLEIFLPWHPQTSASSERRLRVLESLLEREPEVGWDLLRRLLPTPTSYANGTRRPRWREWADDAGEPITRASVDRFTDAVLRMMLSVVGTDGARWGTLVEALPNLRDAEPVLGGLGRLDAVTCATVNRLLICKAIRNLVSRHRSFVHAAWAMSENDLARLERIYSVLEPSEGPEQVAWLFGYAAQLMDGREHAPGERLIALQLARREALLRAPDAAEFALALLPVVEEPELLGEALASVGGVEDAVLSGRFGSSDARLHRFARGFAIARIEQGGRTWVAALLDSIAAEWKPEQRAQVLALLVCNQASWERATVDGEQTAHAYWRLVRPWTCAPEDAEVIATKLREHGRARTAVGLLAAQVDLCRPVTSPSIVSALASLLVSDDDDRDEGPVSLGSSVEVLMQALESRDDVEQTDLARLEWNFLPTVRGAGWSPTVLHRQLSVEPAFFCEVVMLVFGRQDRDVGEAPGRSRRRARLAFELLDSWRLDGAGTPKGLAEWVRLAREEFARRDEVEMGDQKLGEALSSPVAPPDVAWPSADACAIIESCRSQELELGFSIGCSNSRGIVSKSFGEGGTQELKLANDLMVQAERHADRWPRVAAMLRGMADEYAADARAEDRRAQTNLDTGRWEVER